MKRRKPRAYLSQICTGHFMLNPTFAWIARDDCGSEVARGRTRKLCEQYTRWAGYVPVR